MKLSKFPNSKIGVIEEWEDYDNETHIAVCKNKNKCGTEFYINYEKIYDLKTMEEMSDVK